MNRYYCLILIAILFSGNTELRSQSDNLPVKRVSFSSGIDDEFSPVFYKNGIVFCSNQRDNSLIVYKGDNSRLFNMFFATPRGKNNWSQPSLFSRELKAGLNVGPATFNNSGSIMYFNRNNQAVDGLKNVSDTTNKLGIFSAESINGRWSDIKPFSRNNPSYTFCTPSLSPDGKRIYFSSDMPGGYGGMDLYYCDSLNTGWSEPVNLGPVVNTPKSESFPFASFFGKLFFASDGHQGFGGKDIYYSLQLNGEWIKPVHLDSAINSPFDDFGLVVDTSFTRGYFSSNRLKTDDIFSVGLPPENFSDCDSLIENKYCFTLYDEHKRSSDTALIYRWDFGRGLIKEGQEVQHCFPGPGKYSVTLNVFDKLTGDTISKRVKYDLNLTEADQPYMLSPNIGVADKELSFNCKVTGLKDFRITGVFWDFGNGFIPGGESMAKSFAKKGDSYVRLGLTGDMDSLGNVARRCVERKIRIYSPENFEQVSGTINTQENSDTGKSESFEKSFEIYSYLMDDLSRDQKSLLRKKLIEISSQRLVFNRDALTDSSDKIFLSIAEILKDDNGIRLEIVVHSSSEEVAEASKSDMQGSLAEYLGFSLKSSEVSRSQFGIFESSSGIPLISDIPSDKHDAKNYFVELIFMKK